MVAWHDGWDRAKSVACDVTVTSPLTPATLKEISIHEGAAALAALAAETRKHAANDARCQALGWTCIPLAVETFGGERKHSALGKEGTVLWGKKARCFGERKHGALGKEGTVLWGKKARCFGERKHGAFSHNWLLCWH